MSNASFAPNFPSPVAVPGQAPAARRGPRCGTVTAPSIQALRLVRLVVVVVGLWLTARWLPTVPRTHSHVSVRRWALRVLGALRVDVRASGHLPASDAPLLVVANHVSWLDSYAINTVSAARFVAKFEVRQWPVIGTIAAGFGTIFLKRGCPRAAARAVACLDQVLRRGEPVAAFPEGTTTDGRGLLRFYPALFQSAVLSAARVQPVAIRYRGGDGSPTQAAAFVGDMSVLDSVRRLLREPRLTAELIFCAPLDAEGRTRRELAMLARAAIVAALGSGGDARQPTPLRRAA